LIIMLINAISVIAIADPYWGGVPYGPGHWFYIEELPYDGDYLPIYKAGAAPIWEINSHGLLTLGSGDNEAGYFSFVGDYELISFNGIDSIVMATFMRPPSLITPGKLIPGRLDAFHHTYSFICRCTDEDDPFPPDSVRLADGLGWWEYFSPLPPEWPYWDGYVYGMCHAHPCKIIPCPPGGGEWEKLWVYFTDSLYTQERQIEDYEIVSGDSPLYIRAEFVGGWSGVKHVRLFLLSNPDEYEIIELQDIGGGSMTGSFESARALGLNSCDDAVVQLYNYLDGDTSAMVGFDAIVVCLPKITTSTDTVIIRTDSMKISEDFEVSLEFVDDNTGEYVYLGNRIDSAGYRYRSFWVANSNLPEPGDHKRYDREYPIESSYIWWDGQTTNCLTTFLRDSLYVVGGSLSVDCKGALSPVQDIDNSFDVTTDTLIRGQPKTTKLILIVVDPQNEVFEEHFITERIKAIAWQEGAGLFNQGTNLGMPRWNNYWEADAERPNNSRMPCEGSTSKDAGIMQMNRYWLEKVFNGSYDGGYPVGRFYCSWDSLIWNWQLNIFNAKWWIEQALYEKMTETQKGWPDSCSFLECGSVPTEPNKEDLSNYGYHSGESVMRTLNDDDAWYQKIFKPKGYLEEDFAKYAKLVRKWRYDGTLW